jgi:quercetin dioxygenase-like cupin family protein
MDVWDIEQHQWKPHRPEILVSSDHGRAIVLDLPAGEMLREHQVHEAAWITVVSGEVSITDDAGQAIDARPGVVVHMEPKERHEVLARTDARLLLLLAPWPGEGHPGAMTLEEKAGVRRRAAERAA